MSFGGLRERRSSCRLGEVATHRPARSLDDASAGRVPGAGSGGGSGTSPGGQTPTSSLTLGPAAPHRGSRLGDRLRQLRVSAGLTQTRARRRALLEGVHLADRARQDAPDARDGRVARRAARRRRARSSRAASRTTSGRAPRRSSRAREALTERRDFDVAIEEFTKALAAVVATGVGRAAGARPLRRGLGAMHRGDVRAGDRAARRRRGARRGPVVLGSRPRRAAVPARRRPLPDLEHRDRGRALRRGAHARRALAAAVRPAAARTCSPGARAATAASATTRPHAKTSRARSSWPSRWTTRARSATRTSRRRSSPSATASGSSRGRTPSARRAQYEELTDRMNVGRLLNNLGGLEFLLGKPDGGDRAAEGGLLDRPRARQRRRCRDGDLVARAGAPEAPATPVAAEEHARHALRRLGTREDRLDEIGNARLVLGRALLEQGRLDEAEATLADAEDALAQLSSGPHRAAAWVAQGDLAQRRGDDRQAAALYRRAAESPPGLQVLSGARSNSVAEGGELLWQVNSQG